MDIANSNILLKLSILQTFTITNNVGKMSLHIKLFIPNGECFLG